MKKKFICDCNCHMIEFTYDKATKRFPFGVLSIAIYDLFGKVKKLKKPKLLADVVIINRKYEEELDNLIKYFKKLGEIHEPEQRK